MPACSTGDRASGESKAEAAGASPPYPRRERGGGSGSGQSEGGFRRYPQPAAPAALPAPQAAARVDRRLAEAEFRPIYERRVLLII